MQKNSRVVTGCIAFLFSACMLVARSYNKLDNWNLIFGSKRKLLFSIFMLIIIIYISYIVLSVLYNKMNDSSRQGVKGNTFSKKIFEEHPFRNTWMVMILLWLPNYLLYFPGCLTYDVIRQYEQFFSGEITNHHPVLTTFFESVFIKWGRMLGNQNIGLALYLFCTLLFTSAVFAIGFCWMKKRGIPYWIRWMALLFYSVFPLWSAYARTAVKDTLFYPMFILFVLFFFEIILSRGTILEQKNTNVVFLFLSILLCLVRHNGIYIVCASFPFCIWWCKKYRKQCVVLFLILFLFLGSYQKLFLPIIGVTPGGTQEMLSIPFQQTARYVKYHKSEITASEERDIRKVLDYDSIGKNYNPDLSDPVKNTYTQDDEYLGRYFSTWIEQLKKHPTTYIQATLNGTYGYWGYMSEIRYPYGYYSQPESMNEYQKKYKIKFSDATKNLREKYERGLEIVFIKTPFNLLTKPMIYTWGFVVLLGFCIGSTLYRKYCIAFLPVIVSFLICLASPVNGDMRYMLPLSSTLFLYLAFVYGILQQSEEKKEVLWKK